MESIKQHQIMRVAKKYYELHMGQLEIAQEEGISKSTVSRLLQKAIDLGYVKVTVEYPIESVSEIEDQLKDIFKLKDVFITPIVVDNDEIIMKDTCRALANNLDSYIKNDSIVGVSWGRTLNCLSSYITHLQAKNIKVVQLNGGVTKHDTPTGAYQIVDSLAHAGKGIGYMFPVPAIVDSKEIADVIRQDSQVNKVLELAKEAEVTIFSIGAFSKNSILYEVGYLQDREYEDLTDSMAVGDIASRYFTVGGKIASQNFNDRVVGLDLDNLKTKKYNIAIAVGVNKVNAILGALMGSYLNVLYTDENTARTLLNAYCHKTEKI